MPSETGRGFSFGKSQADVWPEEKIEAAKCTGGEAAGTLHRPGRVGDNV
jgi:hypothetical protein